MESQVLRREQRALEREILDGLALHYLRLAGARKPPVPANIVALFDPGHSVHIELLPMKGRRGALDYDDGEWLIFVNAKDSPLAQRFTVIHEGAHIIERVNGWPFSIENDAHRQWVCDSFAASLLMPTDMVRQRAQNRKTSYGLAMLFQVSHIAMIRRLHELGMEEHLIDEP